jgi:hypothetical protein
MTEIPLPLHSLRALILACGMRPRWVLIANLGCADEHRSFIAGSTSASSSCSPPRRSMPPRSSSRCTTPCCAKWSAARHHLAISIIYLRPTRRGRRSRPGSSTTSTSIIIIIIIIIITAPTPPAVTRLPGRLIGRPSLEARRSSSRRRWLSSCKPMPSPSRPGRRWLLPRLHSAPAAPRRARWWLQV